MDIWFMYDNHTFAKVGTVETPRADMERRAAELFAEDGCGMLATRWEQDRGPSIYLHGRILDLGGAYPGSALQRPRYGVTPEEISAFFDRVDEAINWGARG